MDDGHERPALMLLIPFYLNGTIGSEDRERLEAGLATDPNLRAELEAARAVAALVREGGEAMTRTNDDATARLRGLLARLPARNNVSRLPRAAPFGFRPRISLGAALAACLAIVVVQAGVIGWQALGVRPGYVALQGAAAPAPSPARLIVTIAPGATWSDVEHMLSSRGLRIVDGPRNGSLDLAVADGVTPEDEALWLGRSPLIAFAGVVP